MRNTHRLILLAGTAVGALALTGPAFAFDGVNWDWNKVVTETDTIDGTITSTLAPTGLVQLEKMQVFIGDLTADSKVSGINNIQPTPAASGTVDFTVSWAGVEDDQPHPSTFGTGVLGGPQATLSGSLTGSGDLAGTIDEGTDAMQLSATFKNVSVSLPGSASYDALVELPEVVSAGTAVGNNQSITSDVATYVHDAQFVFGGYDPTALTPTVALAGQSPLATGLSNTSLSSVLAFAISGASGLITPATIEASSTVSDIKNATVDSTATAVANNANIELAAATAGDQIVMGDFVQGAMANITATSDVSAVSLNQYINLGKLDRPIVNSAATAIGNSVSVKVSGPKVP